MKLGDIDLTEQMLDEDDLLEAETSEIREIDRMSITDTHGDGERYGMDVDHVFGDGLGSGQSIPTESFNDHRDDQEIPENPAYLISGGYDNVDGEEVYVDLFIVPETENPFHVRRKVDGELEPEWYSMDKERARIEASS